MDENKNNENAQSQPVNIADVRGSLSPFVCPICGGNGQVQNGFYRQIGGQWLSSDCTPETCRSCNGTGIVWG